MYMLHVHVHGEYTLVWCLHFVVEVGIKSGQWTPAQCLQYTVCKVFLINYRGCWLVERLLQC